MFLNISSIEYNSMFLSSISLIDNPSAVETIGHTLCTRVTICKGYFMTQSPPFAGPFLSMIPSAFSLASCFSTALAEIPIFSAREAALVTDYCSRVLQLSSLGLKMTGEVQIAANIR